MAFFWEPEATGDLEGTRQWKISIVGRNEICARRLYGSNAADRRFLSARQVFSGNQALEALERLKGLRVLTLPEWRRLGCNDLQQRETGFQVLAASPRGKGGPSVEASKIVGLNMFVR